jgi:hypothetical protein
MEVNWEERAKAAEAQVEQLRKDFRQVMELNLKLLEINDKLSIALGMK